MHISEKNVRAGVDKCRIKNYNIGNVKGAALFTAPFYSIGNFVSIEQSPPGIESKKSVFRR